jgi:hypothetical protein
MSKLLVGSPVWATAGQDIGFPCSELENFFDKHDQFSAEAIFTT